MRGPMGALHHWNIVGGSPAILDVRKKVEAFGLNDAPVLIGGETGTGKELVARGIHYQGERGDHAFIAVNCSTFTDELLISELFGYRKGAFTGAREDHCGLLEAAHGGTLFLDEVDSLSAKAQASLLRFLQEGEFRPVGDVRTRRVDVRILVATNADLWQLAQEKKFREDLYFRMHVLTIRVPALRDRTEDIPLLVEHFWTSFERKYGMKHPSPAPESIAGLQRMAWPGNVRELENFIHRAYLLHNLENILQPRPAAPETLSAKAPVHAEAETSVEPFAHDTSSVLDSMELPSFNAAKRDAIGRFEKQYLCTLLQRTGGNVTKASDLCGKERRLIGKMIKKYNIDKMTMASNFQ